MRIKMSRLALILVIILVTMAGCTSQEAQPAVTEQPLAPSTAAPVPITAVVMDYAEHLNAGDLEGSLAYYDDDAMFYVLGLPPTGTEILSGKEQIRTMLEENVASHFKMEIDVLSVVGDVITTRTTTWHDFTRELGVAPLEATEIYVIENGKIATEAWHISENSLAKLKPALEAATPAEPGSAPPAKTPASEMTVTIAGGTCVYEGPMTLRVGQIAVTMDVQDQDKDKYALTFFNLEPGKGLDDLMASTILDSPPSWADMITFAHEALPGENKQFNIAIEKGPVYLVCWSKPPDLAIGSIGPYAVAE